MYIAGNSYFVTQCHCSQCDIVLNSNVRMYSSCWRHCKMQLLSCKCISILLVVSARSHWQIMDDKFNWKYAFAEQLQSVSRCCAVCIYVICAVFWTWLSTKAKCSCLWSDVELACSGNGKWRCQNVSSSSCLTNPMLVILWSCNVVQNFFVF